MKVKTLELLGLSRPAQTLLVVVVPLGQLSLPSLWDRQMMTGAFSLENKDRYGSCHSWIKRVGGT